MARTTITQITDDLDGSKDAEEVSFSFRGVDYVIDLGKKNQAAMEKALKPYLEAASKSARSRGATPKRASTRRPTGRSGRSKSGAQDLAAVRTWARDNGIEVSDRGRIPRAVMEQYSAATR